MHQATLYLFYAAWDDAPVVMGVAALHRVRLACACLAIAEQAHVVTIQRRLYQL